MTMNNKKQSGFTLIEVLLSIIALGVIVFVGFYIYSQISSQTTSKSASSATKKIPAKKAVDPIAGWTAFTTPGGSFSFQYPATWSKNVCDANNVLLGPTPDSDGHCQSDDTPQIYLSSVKGDQTQASKMNPANTKDIVSVPVTVDGVTGTKESGTINSSEPILIGPPSGSKVVTYLFYKNDTTYTISYTQTPDLADVLSDFNLLVTRTFKFTN